MQAGLCAVHYETTSAVSDAPAAPAYSNTNARRFPLHANIHGSVTLHRLTLCLIQIDHVDGACGVKGSSTYS
jgi:hypothetical protein